MIGVSRETGLALAGLDHLWQSIRDILTTPIGSRVMRRDYGSRLLDLIDRPSTPAGMVEFYAATAEALERWEPRFRLDSATATATVAGQVSITLTGRYLPEGRVVTLEGIVL